MMAYETAQELFDALCTPFPASSIEWRIGSTNEKYKKPDEPLKGIPLCYIDARVVMDRLDTICGPENWQCNYTPGVASSIICNLGIKMPDSGQWAGQWIWKADGAGATDIEGEKGMLSDAFKRAAVRWGVGRYLYDLKAEWIPLEGKRGIAKEQLKKLNELHEDFAQQVGWGDRAGVYSYRLTRRTIEQYIPDALEAQQFKKNNAGMIAQLPVAMRKHLNDTLDRIGATVDEVAAVQ